MSYVTSVFDEQVVDMVKGGAVGLVPSDTIYGLSCSALNQLAVAKLHKLKDRSAAKPFIILISDVKMLDLLSIDKQNLELIDKYWPGPLTAIFPAPNSPGWLNLGLASLAIRLPANAALREFISKTGPLISTSANLESEPPLTSAIAAQQLFGEQLDFYIDQGVRSNTKPSTIVTISGDKLKILRLGVLNIEGVDK